RNERWAAARPFSMDITNSPSLAWSPDSRWIAYHGYNQPGTVPYFALADASGKLYRVIEFDPKVVDRIDLDWSADSEYIKDQIRDFQPTGVPDIYHIKLYRIADLKEIALDKTASDMMYSGGWDGHRIAYTSPVPGQHTETNLVVLDAARPEVHVIPIPYKK